MNNLLYIIDEYSQFMCNFRHRQCVKCISRKYRPVAVRVLTLFHHAFFRYEYALYAYMYTMYIYMLITTL